MRAGGGSRLERGIVGGADDGGVAGIRDDALVAVGDGTVAGEVLQSYRYAFGLVELGYILGIGRYDLRVIAERAGVHDLIIHIGQIYDRREVEVEAVLTEQQRLLILLLLYGAEALALEYIAGSVEGDVVERGVTGQGGDRASLLLSRDDGRDRGRGLDVKHGGLDLLLGHIVKGGVIEQHTGQRIAVHIGRGGRGIDGDAHDHLTDHLLLGHPGDICGGLLIIL